MQAERTGEYRARQDARAEESRERAEEGGSTARHSPRYPTKALSVILFAYL